MCCAGAGCLVVGRVSFCANAERPLQYAALSGELLHYGSWQEQARPYRVRRADAAAMLSSDVFYWIRARRYRYLFSSYSQPSPRFKASSLDQQYSPARTLAAYSFMHSGLGASTTTVLLVRAYATGALSPGVFAVRTFQETA